MNQGGTFSNKAAGRGLVGAVSGRPDAARWGRASHAPPPHAGRVQSRIAAELPPGHAGRGGSHPGDLAAAAAGALPETRQGPDAGDGHPGVHGRIPGTVANDLQQDFVDMVQASVALLRFNLPFLSYGKVWPGASGWCAILPSACRPNAPARTKTCSPGGPGQRRSWVGFQRRDVVNHMIFLMMAAHDTTTSTLTSVVRVLAEHPQWQHRLREEMQALPRRWPCRSGPCPGRSGHSRSLAPVFASADHSAFCFGGLRVQRSSRSRSLSGGP